MRSILLKTFFILLGFVLCWIIPKYAPIPEGIIPKIPNNEITASPPIPNMAIVLIDSSSSEIFATRLAKIRDDLANDKNIVVIDRKNEDTFLTELERQSQIPASIESINPIGELLVPSHLLREEVFDNGILQQLSVITLSEIKSGKILWQDTKSWNLVLEYVKNNTKALMDITYSLILFILLLPIIFYIGRPLSAIFKNLDQQDELTKLYLDSMGHIKSGNIELGTKLLAQCAHSNFDGKEKHQADEILKTLGTINNSERV